MYSGAIGGTNPAHRLGNMTREDNIKDIVTGVNSKLTSLEMGGFTKNIHHRITLVLKTQLLFNVISILNCVLWYDGYHAGMQESFLDLYLYVALGCSLVTAPMIFYHKILKIKYFQYKAVLPREASLTNTGLLWEALFEILLSFIQPLPWLSSTPSLMQASACSSTTARWVCSSPTTSTTSSAFW